MIMWSQHGDPHANPFQINRLLLGNWYAKHIFIGVIIFPFNEHEITVTDNYHLTTAW